MRKPARAKKMCVRERREERVVSVRVLGGDGRAADQGGPKWF